MLLIAVKVVEPVSVGCGQVLGLQSIGDSFNTSSEISFRKSGGIEGIKVGLAHSVGVDAGTAWILQETDSSIQGVVDAESRVSASCVDLEGHHEV